MSRARDLADGTFSGAFSADSPTLVVDDANNRVGVGTASPSVNFNVKSTYVSATTVQQRFEDNTGTALDFGGTGSGEKWINAADVGTPSTGYPILFKTGGTERMRLITTGALLINATAYADVGLSISYPDSSGVYSRTGNTSSVYHYRFHNPNGLVGGILTSGSATSYQTSSDYRLKEDWQPILGSIDRVKALNPVNFAWKVDGSRVDGFLAHEVADVVPEAISGEKDGMRTEEYEVTSAVLDDDGNVVTEAVMGTREVPEYQGIDQSKLVPLLTAAIKEQQAMIEDLQTRLAALETP